MGHEQEQEEVVGSQRGYETRLRFWPRKDKNKAPFWKRMGQKKRDKKTAAFLSGVRIIRNAPSTSSSTDESQEDKETDTFDVNAPRKFEGKFCAEFGSFFLLPTFCSC